MHQFPSHRYHFTPIGAGKLFEVLNENRTEREIDNGMVLRKGISKGVRIVKGTDGKPTPALVVDCELLLNQNLFIFAIPFSESEPVLQGPKPGGHHQEDPQFSRRIPRQPANVG